MQTPAGNESWHSGELGSPLFGPPAAGWLLQNTH